MRALSSLAAGVVLRASLSGGDGPRLDRFWDTTTRVAHLCARLTQEFRGVPTDTAYSFGLFHDCGIAVLMRRFPDYRETLQIANTSEEFGFTEVEDQRHATNHATLGYLLTRNWGLPEEIRSATLMHHDFSIFAADADNTAAKTRTLVSFATLAAYFVNSSQRLSDDANWLRGKDAVMAHLGISDQDLFDLRESCADALNDA
jgi:HD-like signal output (HDOD) protein